MQGWLGGLMFAAGCMVGAGIYGLAEQSAMPLFQITVPARASAAEGPRPCNGLYTYSRDESVMATLADIKRCLFDGAAR